MNRIFSSLILILPLISTALVKADTFQVTAPDNISGSFAPTEFDLFLDPSVSITDPVAVNPFPATFTLPVPFVLIVDWTTPLTFGQSFVADFSLAGQTSIGAIAGYGWDNNAIGFNQGGEIHGFPFRPDIGFVDISVPEPSMIALASIGLLGLLGFWNLTAHCDGQSSPVPGAGRDVPRPPEQENASDHYNSIRSRNWTLALHQLPVERERPFSLLACRTNRLTSAWGARS